MRYYLVFLFLLSVPAIAQQKKNITYIFENEPLEKVLKWLHKTHDIKLAYDNELIKGVAVSGSLENASVSESLDIILANTNLSFVIINNKVVITPKRESIAGQPSRYDFRLAGSIKDGTSGESLPNAVIEIKGTGSGAVSNVDGFFTLAKVPNDTCTLRITYLGYMPKEIRLSPDMPLDNLEVPLQTNTEILEDITITDQYDNALLVNEKISRIAFNPQALSNLPSMGEQDLFRTLQLMPGVSGTNESSSGLVIRGSLPSQNLVLLDGFTLYHLDHFFGVFSALNPDIIKDVQIYKSGYNSKYGGRVSGVVDITGKSGTMHKPTFTFGANLISWRATAQLPIDKKDKLSFLISIRKAYTNTIQSSLYKKLVDVARKNDDQLNRPIDDSQFEEIQPSLNFTDFNAKLSYHPSGKDIIALTAYGGEDHLHGESSDSIFDAFFNIYYSEKLRETSDWGNGGLSLRWGRQWNPKYYSNLRLSFSEFYHDYAFSYNYQLDSGTTSQSADFLYDQNNKITDASLTFDSEYLLNDFTTLEFGFSTIEHHISYITKYDNGIADERNDAGKVTSWYSTGKFNLTKKLIFSAGARFNHHEISNQFYTSPRLTTNYRLSDQINFKAAYGLYYQFANQVLYDHPYNGSQNLWTLSIPPVRSNHYVIGSTFRRGDYLLDIEAYYKDLSEVVEFSLQPYYVSEQLLDLGGMVNGRGKMRGLDILLQKETGLHRGWISYSLSRSLQSFPDVENGDYFPSLQDQTHEVKVVNMVTLGKWDLSSSWIYGSGRPYSKYDIQYFNDAEGNVSDFVVVKDHTNLSRLPDYHRLDISAAYNIRHKKLSGQVGLSIFNVYSHKNIKTRKLNISDLQWVIGTPEHPKPTYRDLVLLDFTPSIFVEFSF